MTISPISEKRKFVVGNRRFDNNVDALQYFSKHPKEPLYFDMGYSFIHNERLWTIEPPKDIKEYLQEHAKHISSIYDNIIIYYSGGTDSHTMLSAFFDAGIPNVKLIINDNYREEASKYNPKNESTVSLNNHVGSELFAKFGEKMNALNYSIESLTFYPKIKPCSYYDYYNILKDRKFGDFETNLRTHFLWLDQASSSAPVVCKKNSANKKTCVIVGREKPRVTLLKNGFWAWQVNSAFTHDIYGKLDDDNADLIDFYFSDAVPEIQIKLTWEKIKILEKIIKINQLPFTTNTIEKLQSTLSEHYTTINAAMGYTALNQYLFSNNNKKELESIVETESRKRLVQYRNSNNIYNLIDEFHKDAIKDIREDLLNENNKIPSIKSIAVPVCPSSNLDGERKSPNIII